MKVIIDYNSAISAIEEVIHNLDKGTEAHRNFTRILSWNPPYGIRSTLKVQISPQEYELLQDYLGE